MFAAYTIRFDETPQEGRYWLNFAGQRQKPEDEEFNDQRSAFIQELIAFNELKEARKLRQAMFGMPVYKPDPEFKID